MFVQDSLWWHRGLGTIEPESSSCDPIPPMILCKCYFYNSARPWVCFSKKGRSHTTAAPAPTCTRHSSQCHLLPVPRHYLYSILYFTAALGLLACYISTIHWLPALLFLLVLPHTCSLTNNFQVSFANLCRAGVFYLLSLKKATHAFNKNKSQRQ